LLDSQKDCLSLAGGFGGGKELLHQGIKMGPRCLRERGVAVVIRHGKVLLVRDRGKHRFSLPGGGIKKGERANWAKMNKPS
jgi:hypothetical protein